MDTLQNIKAFLLSARQGSFSGAARELGVAPSVITKRVTQLEDRMDVQLFKRSTRQLTLTDAGERLLPRYTRLLAEIEDTLNDAKNSGQGIEGHLRISAPTTITTQYLGALFSEFQARNPGLVLDIILLDRSVNPLEEGYDFVIGARGSTYANVETIPLCPYPLVLCGTPEYLARKGEPKHPKELVDHDCLTSLLFGTTWQFESPQGELDVPIRSKFNVNDNCVVLEAARRGIGLALLPRFLIDEQLRSGELRPLLEDFPIVSLWVKALIPKNKIMLPSINALVAFLRDSIDASPLWQSPDDFKPAAR